MKESVTVTASNDLPFPKPTLCPASATTKKLFAVTMTLTMKVKVATRMCLRLNISKTVRDSWVVWVNGAPIGNSVVRVKRLRHR